MYYIYDYIYYIESFIYYHIYSTYIAHIRNARHKQSTTSGVGHDGRQRSTTSDDERRRWLLGTDNERRRTATTSDDVQWGSFPRTLFGPTIAV
jgi:hypothetical protein